MRLAMLVLLSVLMGVASSVRASELALVGARLYPSPDAAPIERATIVIRDGVITAVGGADVAIPKDCEILEVTGQVVVAGFWNSHVHLLQEPYRKAAVQPAATLTRALDSNFGRWGFTTVFDIASLPGDALALRGRIARGEVIGPHILTVDAPFFPEHGTPIYVKDLLEQLKVPSFEVKDAASARMRAARQLEAGADGIKLFAGAIVGGKIGVLPMETPIARAVVEEAHRAGKISFAHPTDFS